MAYQASHPVDVGCFGHFRHGGKKIVDDWEALEELCFEYCGGMWIGIYSAWDIIGWARRIGLISDVEYGEWVKVL